VAPDAARMDVGRVGRRHRVAPRRIDWVPPRNVLSNARGAGRARIGGKVLMFCRMPVALMKRGDPRTVRDAPPSPVLGEERPVAVVLRMVEEIL